MKRTLCVFCLAFFFATQPLAVLHAQTVDTDGDGLLDLLDVPGFNPNAIGQASFYNRGIQDLDGANRLTNLQSLSLEGNQITSIERGDFAGLTNLQRLFLYNNHITSIESGDFDGLANLWNLSVEGNQITSIESGAFQGLTNLQELLLDDNQITSIETGAFQGLANLEVLFLGGNQITSIESGDFDGLANPYSLSLWGNQITSIESGDFDGLANLNLLSIGNNITSIDSGDFDGLTNLEGLWLEGNQITSIESGDFDGLANLQSLFLGGNQITSIESGDFDGLTNLQGLWLEGNQITSIDSGDFDGLTNLRTLVLEGNHITELNFTGAMFEHLEPCFFGMTTVGFCVDGDEITSLILDDATLSSGSFEAIIKDVFGRGRLLSIADASLVGLTFSDENPTDLSSLFSIATLVNVTVDQALFDLYAAEFTAFDAIDGNTVTVVPGLCDTNRDGTCDVNDIDAMTQMVLDGSEPEDRRIGLIQRPSPDGFYTYFGDANLDGEFNSGDFVHVFEAGQYEDGIQGNSTWATGDWSGDHEFGSSDLVVAFQDGGYEQGPRQEMNAVPEPTGDGVFAAAFLMSATLLGHRRSNHSESGSAWRVANTISEGAPS